MNDHGSPNMYVTHYKNRTLATALLQFILRPFGHLITKPGKPLPGPSSQLKPPRSILRHCNVNTRQIEDIWICDITAKDPAHDSEHATAPTRRIYYIAGGSFCMPPSSDHWKFCAELSRKLMGGVVVSLISPPLAPNCPAPVTLPHLVKLYTGLMRNEKSEIVNFVGDSSGGNLVMSLILTALGEDPAVRTPESIMLISPAVDLRFINSEINNLERKDPVLRLPVEVKTAKSWASSWPLDDQRLSPVLADLSVLKEKQIKVHGVTGGYDILTPDTLLFRDKCKMGGVAGEWLEWDKQMHCFPIAFTYHFPESVQGKDWILDVLNRIT